MIISAGSKPYAHSSSEPRLPTLGMAPKERSAPLSSASLVIQARLFYSLLLADISNIQPNCCCRWPDR